MSKGNGDSPECFPCGKEEIYPHAFYNRRDLERLLEGCCQVDSFLRAVKPVPIVDGVWLGASLLAAIERTIQSREQRRNVRKPIGHKKTNNARGAKIKNIER